MENNEKFARDLVTALFGAALSDIESKEEKKKDWRKDTAVVAKPLYDAYLGFMDAGFNEKQAFALLMSAQKKGE